MSGGVTEDAAAIVRLPQSVADAIAAGEVVDRPASVVKELCENAVDAGAGSIDVTVDGGGTVRIRVVDDGAGIVAAQLPLALARHATSKIRAAADLEAVATLGFRGEALASIAAVADLTIRSRPPAEPVGARLRVRHGVTMEEGDWGGPPGTSVEVLDLFAATPARLRFLRSARAETAAALAAVSDLALIRPSLRVSCAVDGRTRFRTAGTGLEGALRSVLGAQATEFLAVADDGDVCVGGVISEPRRHRGSRTGLVLAVNGRRVHNRALAAAVAEAYRGLIPSGRYPFGVVSVAVDPLEVDVNVHPTKREVRFRDERQVFAAVQRACWQALRGATVYHLGGLTERGLDLADDGTGWNDGRDTRPPPPLGHRDPDGLAPARADQERRTEGVAAPVEMGESSTLASLAPLRALGQQEGRWMVAASAAGVVVVDPHAAHEKVVYAGLLSEWASGSGSGQLLLIPALLECDARRLEVSARHAELVAGCGFLVEPFGPTTLRCTAVPAAAGGADPGRLLGDLLDSLAGGGPVTEQRHRAAALIACHAAVRFGDQLNAAEQQRLLDRLVDTPGGLTCPHGRPTVTLLDDATLRRVFGRPAR